MAEDTVECFNCGRPNPAWAHVCRHCGVPLRPDAPIVTPTGFVPTDEGSLVSMAAAVATILAAVFIGFVLSNLIPTTASVGLASPTASPSPSETPEPTEEPVPTSTAAPPVETPPPETPVPLPGTVAFGTGIDADGQITGPTDTFAPGTPFAQAVTMPEAFGVPALGEQVSRVAEDGTETEVATAAANQLPVDPESNHRGVVCCDSVTLLNEWGPGTYLLRVYRGEELIAQGRFVLTPGG
jgi:hypothetical protein